MGQPPKKRGQIIGATEQLSGFFRKTDPSAMSSQLQSMQAIAVKLACDSYSCAWPLAMSEFAHHGFNLRVMGAEVERNS